MKKKIIALTLGALLFALCVSAEAQQPVKVGIIKTISESKGLVWKLTLP